MALYTMHSAHSSLNFFLNPIHFEMAGKQKSRILMKAIPKLSIEQLSWQMMILMSPFYSINQF